MGANGPRHQAVGGAIELISAQFSALYSYSSRRLATAGSCMACKRSGFESP